MKVLSSTLIILLGLLFPLAMSSQTPTQRPKTGAEDVVRISTNLIQVDATVSDKHGKILAGLTADDFEIYENNKKQQITNFSFVELAPDKPKEPITIKPGKNSIPIQPVPIRLPPEDVRRTLALVVDDLGLSADRTNGPRTSSSRRYFHAGKGNTTGRLRFASNSKRLSGEGKDPSCNSMD